MQDSIIVYRNPIEKAFWEGDLQTIGIIIGVMVAAFILIVGGIYISSWFKNRRNSPVRIKRGRPYFYH